MTVKKKSIYSALILINITILLFACTNETSNSSSATGFTKNNQNDITLPEITDHLPDNQKSEDAIVDDDDKGTLKDDPPGVPKSDDSLSGTVDLDMPVSPSLIIELSLDELITLSDQIVTGTITETKSDWDKDHTNIFTLSKLLINQCLKGPHCNELVIKVPGGKVGEILQWVEDSASFETGETVLLFLNNNHDGTFSLTGAVQGKYKIANEEIHGIGKTIPELKDYIDSLY